MPSPAWGCRPRKPAAARTSLPWDLSTGCTNAIPPPPPQPNVLPAQVQVAQGATIAAAAIAVTASDKGGNANQTKNETGSKPEQDDRRRGKLIDRYA